MKQYVVDAFTEKVFSGNPAAICVLDSWLDEKTMMSITIENNLSETAFTVKEGDKYKLRWFTPGGEIDLCGHATLACAYVVMNRIEPDLKTVTFSTMSGDLIVNIKGDLYEMDFPAYDLKPVEITDAMVDAIGAKPVEVYMGRDLLCVFDDEKTVRELKPNLDKLNKNSIVAYQASPRGGTLYCTKYGDRVRLSGKAALYSEADINIG